MVTHNFLIPNNKNMENLPGWAIKLGFSLIGILFSLVVFFLKDFFSKTTKNDSVLSEKIDDNNGKVLDKLDAIGDRINVLTVDLTKISVKIDAHNSDISDLKKDLSRIKDQVAENTAKLNNL